MDKDAQGGSGAEERVENVTRALAPTTNTTMGENMMTEPYALDIDESERIISDYVHKSSSPYFFSNPYDKDLAAVHTEIQRGIEAAEETVTLDLPLSLIYQAEECLKDKGWTLEEAINLFLYWHQKCPDAVQNWKASHSINSWQEDEQ